MNALRKTVFDTLDGLGISYEVVEHPAVYTIEEMDQLHIGSNDEVVKNLFIRDDKKKRYFIVVLRKDKTANLKDLREKLGCRPLSFASEESLHTILGLGKGSVTPFGLLNDVTCMVEAVFDREVMAFAHIGVHPNDNTATVFIRPEDLESVIRSHGNSVIHVDI